jgi:multiple antibiotic resistance protein
MKTDALITFATAMFAILNPIGSVAIFAGMVSNYSAAERRSIAIRSCLAMAVILVGTVWAGEFILKLFAVDIASLQVAGGVMISWISISMLQSNQNAIHDSKVGPGSAEQDIAIVPLAMPMVAGPGAIVTVMVTTHQHHGMTSNLEISAVCTVMAGAIFLCFLSAGFIGRVLGTRGMDILTKFMGMVLLAIGIGMLATGVKTLFPGLAA